MAGRFKALRFADLELVTLCGYGPAMRLIVDVAVEVAGRVESERGAFADGKETETLPRCQISQDDAVRRMVRQQASFGMNRM